MSAIRKLVGLWRKLEVARDTYDNCIDTPHEKTAKRKYLSARRKFRKVLQASLPRLK